MFLQARVAELEGEIAAMKTAFSDAEHQQIRALQDLSKVKVQYACDHAKAPPLLAFRDFAV